MSLALYMDENVPRPITNGLRMRGVDVPRNSTLLDCLLRSRHAANTAPPQVTIE
jgi:hypothetical protein